MHSATACIRVAKSAFLKSLSRQKDLIDARLWHTRLKRSSIANIILTFINHSVVTSPLTRENIAIYSVSNLTPHKPPYEVMRQRSHNYCFSWMYVCKIVTWLIQFAFYGTAYGVMKILVARMRQRSHNYGCSWTYFRTYFHGKIVLFNFLSTEQLIELWRYWHIHQNCLK